MRKPRPDRKRGGIPLAVFVQGDAREAAQRAVDDTNTPLEPELRAELKRYLADPMKAATDDLQQLLNERVPLRGGRSTGDQRDEERQLRGQIRKLGERFKLLTATKLYWHQDATEIRKRLKPRRFATILSEESPRRRGQRRTK